MSDNLSQVPLCDLIDMVARLGAARAVADLLARAGMAAAAHSDAIQTWLDYEDVLKAEADQRFLEMREASIRKATSHAA